MHHPCSQALAPVIARQCVRRAHTSVHASQVEPAGGGQLVAGGRMWVSPRGEADGRAVRMQLQGRGLGAESLLRRYLPAVRFLPTHCLAAWTLGCVVMLA